jgi:hypothetical protein
MYTKFQYRKPEGKRSFDKPWRRWVGDIIIDLKAVACQNLEWIYLVQDIVQRRDFVITEMNHFVL